MIFFFYLKFAFFVVIIKTPSSGQNCHAVYQSWTLPIGAHAIFRTKTSKTLCLDFGSISNALSDPWRHKHSKMSKFWKSLEQAWINGVLWSKSIWSKLAPYWINIWTDLKLLLLTASINGVDPVGFIWFGSCFPNFRRTSNIFGSLMQWKIAGLSKLSSRSQPNSHKVFTEKKKIYSKSQIFVQKFNFDKT